MNPQIVRELTQLVSKINVATGILNSFDHNHAVDMFERLLIARIKFEPQEIRRWLVMDGGLMERDANAIKKMGEKFLAGKKVRRRR